ncbi:MAG: HDOD domain-containing protein [Gallionella sp.]|nr:HDOD domain-containing protein [Gallionella sp.]MCK9353651.1 HDOD domain-containing protein [Gallionella sp.]
MPAIAQKLLTLPLDTNEGEIAMLRLIEHDPQLSAKIIGMSNSPLFGASIKTTSVRDAAMLLGMTRVKSVAIGIAAMSALTKMPQGRLSVQNLWLHSLAVALSMRTIAQHMSAGNRPADDQIFLAGLLHDIGYLALAYLDTGLSDELHLRMDEKSDRSILEIEQELLEVTHSELGAQLAHNWQLPNEIITALRYHHMSDSPEVPDREMLPRIINIAEKLLPSFGIAELQAPGIDDAEWVSLGIDPGKNEEICSRIIEQAEQARQLTNTIT